LTDHYHSDSDLVDLDLDVDFDFGFVSALVFLDDFAPAFFLAAILSNNKYAV
jgi:hypothetical protein